MKDRAISRPRRWRAFGLAAVVATFAAACQPAPSGPTGSMAGVPLPLVPGGTATVFPSAINDNGIVIGMDGDMTTSNGARWNLGTGEVTGYSSCAFAYWSPPTLTGSGYGIGTVSGIWPCVIDPNGSAIGIQCVQHVYGCGVADINESGTVAVGIIGSFPGSAVYWNLSPHSGAPISLAGLGGNGTVAIAVDDSGTIFGTAKTAGNLTHPVRWDAATHTPTDLDPTGSDTYQAFANDNEQLVGTRSDGTSYSWDAATGLHPLSVPAGGTLTVRAINGAGRIAGELTVAGRTVPAAWDATTGALRPIANRAFVSTYTVRGITSNGVIYGGTAMGSGGRAFVVLPDTNTTIELGGVDGVYGLNASGTLVFNAGGTGMHAQVTISPNKPTNLQATPSGSEVALTWTGPTFVSGFNRPASYDIFRDNALVTTIDSATTTFTDVGPGSGTHTYAVLARNTSGVASTPPITVVVP